MKENIIIIDDHPLVAKGLGYFLVHHGFNVTSLFSKQYDIFNTLCQLDPEFVVLDIHMPDMNGIDILKVMKTLGLRTKAIIFTGTSSPFYMAECEAAGAVGYIHKTEPLEVFLGAIKAIKTTGTFFPTTLKPWNKEGEKIDENIIGLLTKREIETLKLLAQGYSVKDIAHILSLSNKTISSYKKNVIMKLGTQNLLEAIDIARSYKL